MANLSNVMCFIHFHCGKRYKGFRGVQIQTEIDSARKSGRWEGCTRNSLSLVFPFLIDFHWRFVKPSHWPFVSFSSFQSFSLVVFTWASLYCVGDTWEFGLQLSYLIVSALNLRRNIISGAATIRSLRFNDRDGDIYFKMYHRKKKIKKKNTHQY